MVRGIHSLTLNVHSFYGVSPAGGAAEISRLYSPGRVALARMTQIPALQQPRKSRGLLLKVLENLPQLYVITV